jgi:hypothetical protein
LVDAEEKDKENNTSGKIYRRFTKDFGCTAAEAKKSHISSIWNSIHIYLTIFLVHPRRSIHRF